MKNNNFKNNKGKQKSNFKPQTSNFKKNNNNIMKVEKANIK